VVSYGGPDIGLLCAAGKVRKAVYGFVSLDTIALEPHFRVARQAGTVEAMELDEAGHAQLAHGRAEKGRAASRVAEGQLGLFGAAPDPALAALVAELRALDPDALTPRAALEALYELKRRLRGSDGT